MAKAKVKGLEEEINRVFSRYRSNLKKAIQEAADEAEFDIGFEAKSCLYRYYENFQQGRGQPNWYERSESLENAFVPYNKIIENEKSESFNVSVGMGYDASKLDGLYYHESSNKTFEMPLHEWILKNYLEGIHPITNGFPLYANELEFFEVRDLESPETHMKEYLKEYAETFKDNVLQSFVGKVRNGR